MTTQEQMFPRTTLERLDELTEVHRAEYDKAVKAIAALGDDEKIARAYEKAEERVAKARHLVAAIVQAAERERTRLITRGPDVARSVMQEAADIVNSGALDTDGVTVTASVTPAAQVNTTASPDLSQATFTDKVSAELDAHGVEYQRDKPLPAVDPITGEVEPATVLVLYPGDETPVQTPVGDRTRYSELVADYFTAAGLSAVVDADEWTVVARRELTRDGGGYRSLHDVIAPEDYGQELLVVATDQGSVTGTPADVQEANKLLEDAVR